MAGGGALVRQPRSPRADDGEDVPAWRAHVAVGGWTPDHARSTLRAFASARETRCGLAVRRTVAPRGRDAASTTYRRAPRDDDGERREISRRGPDGSRAGGYPNPAPGTLRKKQNAKDVTPDGIAATAVMYAFAAWQWLQWPAGTPHPRPGPAHAACVGGSHRADRAGAAGGAHRAPTTSRVSQNISQLFPYISLSPTSRRTRNRRRVRSVPVRSPIQVAAPRPSRVRDRGGARDDVRQAIRVFHAYATRREAVTSSPPSSRPRRRWLGTARASAACYVSAWLLQSRGLRDTARRS